MVLLLALFFCCLKSYEKVANLHLKIRSIFYMPKIVRKLQKQDYYLAKKILSK